LKILYVTRELPYGMAEAHILPEIASHRTAGWDVWITELRRTDMTHQQGPELLKRTFDEPLISPRVVLGALIEVLRSPLRVARLAFELTRSGTFKNLAQNLASFPKALWLAEIIRANKFEHIHVHWAGAPATYASFAAYLAGVPYSMTAHRYDIAQKNLLPWKASHAQFVRVIDEPGADEFHEALGPAGERPLVIHVGVKVPAETAPLRNGVLKPLRIVTGARLVEKKGHAYLFEGIALAKAQGVDVDLDLFGDGPLENTLATLAQKLDIADRIHFRGVSSHESLLSALRAGVYDVAALPSVTGVDGDKEGIPVFLMEAMAAGIPVLTTPNGGILELAGNGHGVVVPERESAAIGEALVKLAQDETLRRHLSQSGRAHVQSDFEVETSISRLRGLIAPRGRGEG
jgi:glycosyltransferase involved in cell wall biosynthesis